MYRNKIVVLYNWMKHSSPSLLKTTFKFELIFILLVGCGTGTKKSILSPVSLKERQRQTKFYDIENETNLLNASLSVLQDMGFTVDESEKDLGLLTASKTLSANPLSTLGTIAALGLILLSKGEQTLTVEEKQKVSVNLVTIPHKRKNNKYAVRINFQRIVWDSEGGITKIQRLRDSSMYEIFV